MKKNKENYQQAVDALIKQYVKRLENDISDETSLMSGKEMLAYLHAHDRYPYKKKLSDKNYEKQMVHLQVELVKAQYWIQKTGQKVAVVFEGRDAAGKGGNSTFYDEP